MAQLQARIDSDNKRVRHIVAEQILSDCRPFVPKQEGTLNDTASIRDNGDATEIVWDTPYAAYQYYGCWPDGSHVIHNHTTPGTTTQWCETARRAYGDAWETVAQNALKNG